MKLFAILIISLSVFFVSCSPDTDIVKEDSEKIKQYSILFDDEGIADISRDVGGSVIYIEDDVHRVGCWIYNKGGGSSTGGGIACIPYDSYNR